MREAPEKANVDPVTQLTESETKEFENWLGKSPQLRERDNEDQIALFRDYLREQ